MVVGLAEGQKESVWWDERVATKHEQIEGCVSNSCSQWENLATAEEKEADIYGSWKTRTWQVLYSYA